MLSPDPFPNAEALPQQEFESLAQQMPVPWTWRTLGALHEQALASADGIAYDTVQEKSGRCIVIVASVTDPGQVSHIEKVLGLAPKAARSRDWARTTLFEMALKTALGGGFIYEGVRGEARKRTAINFCAAGEKGMRVIESLLPQAAVPIPQGVEHQSAAGFAHAKAEEIIARLALPEDLRGRTINFVAFESDADCAYFHPGRTREQHEQIFAAFQARLFSSGVQFSRTVLTPAMFEEAGQYGGDPTNWAERRTFLMPSARGSKTYRGEGATGPEALE